VVEPQRPGTDGLAIVSAYCCQPGEARHERRLRVEGHRDRIDVRRVTVLEPSLGLFDEGRPDIPKNRQQEEDDQGARDNQRRAERGYGGIERGRERIDRRRQKDDQREEGLFPPEPWGAREVFGRFGHIASPNSIVDEKHRVMRVADQSPIPPVTRKS